MESSRDVVFTSCRAGTHRTHLVMQEDGEAWCGGELLHNTHFLTAFCHFSHKAAADRQMGGGGIVKNTFFFLLWWCNKLCYHNNRTISKLSYWLQSDFQDNPYCEGNFLFLCVQCGQLNCAPASSALDLVFRPDSLDLVSRPDSSDLVFGPGFWTWSLDLILWALFSGPDPCLPFWTRCVGLFIYYLGFWTSSSILLH